MPKNRIKFWNFIRFLGTLNSLSEKFFIFFYIFLYFLQVPRSTRKFIFPLIQGFYAFTPSEFQNFCPDFGQLAMPEFRPVLDYSSVLTVAVSRQKSSCSLLFLSILCRLLEFKKGPRALASTSVNWSDGNLGRLSRKPQKVFGPEKPFLHIKT